MEEQNQDPWMDDGGPAFPCGDGRYKLYKGMSLRDYFAAKAMQGLMAGYYSASWPDPKILANECYLYADALLERREK